MRAGELDRLITVQRMIDPDSVSPPLRDQLGGVVEEWADVYRNLPAGIRTPRRGGMISGAVGSGEATIANARFETIDIVFFIRWMPNIDDTMRILYDGGIYNIEGCRREVGRHDGLLIEVRKRAVDQRKGD
jgi:head-tail adaptor